MYSKSKSTRPIGCGRSGLHLDRIQRILNEHWPEIWQASVDRQNIQLQQRRSLLIAARQQLQKKAS